MKQEHGDVDSSPSTATTVTTDVSVPTVHLLPPSQPPPASSSPRPRPSTPPAPAVVKQEPLSPERVSGPDWESKEIRVTFVQSCTPEPPTATLTHPLPGTF